MPDLKMAAIQYLCNQQNSRISKWYKYGRLQLKMFEIQCKLPDTENSWQGKKILDSAKKDNIFVGFLRLFENEVPFWSAANPLWIGKQKKKEVFSK